ncbi:MAG: energy-coupling factor transporter transmembrane component T family protein [Candidatus Hodarchaeales archaeon]
MSLQHMVSSIDDLITYTEGHSFFYRIDFRIKLLWLVVTIITAVIQLDMLFICYLLFCTVIIEKLGGSPVFMKIRRNKALVTFAFGLVIITFIFSSLNRALVSGVVTPVDYFFYFARSVALGFLAVLIATLFMSILQTTRTIEMTAGRGPTTSLLTFLTFRSVPLVTYHLTNVIDSQRARGLEMEKLGPRTVLKSIKAIFIPLLILLTGSIDRTAKVLEARGITPRAANKSSFIKPHLKKTDWLLFLYIFSQFLLSIWLASLFPPSRSTTTLTFRLFSEFGWI